MNQVQKINKQVHTSSILVCSNDINKSFKSATWIRKTDQNVKILKKQLYQGKDACAYNCNIFDFGSYIHLQLQNCQGLKKIFQYGPIKLDQKILNLLEQQTTYVKYFSVSILLNKNQIYSAKLGFSKNDQSTFTIQLLIDNLELNLDYRVRDNWTNYQQIFLLKNDHPKSIYFHLDSNKTQFLKSLNKLKIYCHYGHHLIINFDSQDNKSLFLIQFMDFMYLSNRLREHTETRRSNLNTISIMQSDVNNLFASNDFFSNPQTPQVPEKVLEDLRNIVFTPNPQFQMQIRERGLGNFQNFLHHQSHKTLPKIVQNLATTSTIKQQSIQEQRDSRRKMKQKSNISEGKSHEFIFAYNKNKKSQQSQNRLAINSIKSGRFSTTNHQPRSSQSRHKNIQNKMISYEQLLERNKFLEQRNKRLQEQNTTLKERLTTFMTFGHRQSKQKNYTIPEFLKARQKTKSKQHRNSNTNNINNSTLNIQLGRVSQGFIDHHRYWPVRNARMTDSKKQDTKQFRNSNQKSKSKIKYRISNGKIRDSKGSSNQILINSQSSKFFKTLY